jgi:hypothetical protein
VGDREEIGRANNRRKSSVTRQGEGPGLTTSPGINCHG